MGDDTGTDPEPTGAERYLADRLRDPKYRAAYAAFRSQFPLPDTADDTGTDWAALADKLLLWSDAANVFEDTDDDRDELRAAAVGLRRLAQLDTAIGDPGNLRLLADTFDLPILRRIADAAVLGSGEQPEATSIAARHQAHYRYCGCLGDSSECCDATCPCHSEARGEQPEGPTP